MTNVIIQCSGTKHNSPFRWNEQIVKFVAHPEHFQSTRTTIFAHPDDEIPNENVTWRDLVERPEAVTECRQAADLYAPSIYQELAQTFGYKNTFILSAGWGLVRGDFRLPDYDITFSQQCREKGKLRRKGDDFKDFNQLPNSIEDCVIFAGLSYLPLISQLTADYPGNRICYYKSERFARDPKIEYRYFETNVRTNWHYIAAKQFIDHFSSNDRPESLQNRSE